MKQYSYSVNNETSDPKSAKKAELLKNKREEKLRSFNEIIYNEFKKSLKSEQENMLRSRVNLAAFNLNTLEKERKHWTELMQLDKASPS